MSEEDFGKFGAYVQQDDILIETMTPKEALTFAAKLRTSLVGDEIHIEVQEILLRLGISHCQNTRIGGFRLKGISGGERKRASIGFEMITEPRLMLLDEPTSGLDSSTALKICKTLKKEARHGMTIMCTIH